MALNQEGIFIFAPDELRQYRDSHREEDYLMIDVRQPEEYEAGHIPGAQLIPLGTLETKIFDLPSSRDLVFYCRSGARSMAAASLAAECEITDKRVCNLTGGILAWEGQTLPGFPRVQVFKGSDNMQHVLLKAMDLEKGAWRFYRRMLEYFSSDPLAPALEALSKEETAHARIVYNFWMNAEEAPEPFEKLFNRLRGDILEGGETLEKVLDGWSQLEGDACTHTIEFALGVEYAAFDLYRTVAEQTENEEMREAFLSISQAEKGHMKSLIKALEICSG